MTVPNLRGGVVNRLKGFASERVGEMISNLFVRKGNLRATTKFNLKE